MLIKNDLKFLIKNKTNLMGEIRTKRDCSPSTETMMTLPSKGRAH